MKTGLRNFLLFIIFTAGYISLSVQLITIRQLGVYVGFTAITTSVIIGLFLVFLTFGYYRGAYLNFNKKSGRKIIANGFLISTVFILLGSNHFLMHHYFKFLRLIDIYHPVLQTFIYCIMFFAVPPYLFGCIVSIASRYLEKYSNNCTGRVMAVDTIGSVLGSIITTLVLMPLIGVNNTISLLIVCCIVAFAVTSKRFGYFKCLFVLTISLIINNSDFLKQTLWVVENNAVSTISVMPVDNGKSKILIVNNSLSSKISSDPNLRYDYVKYIEDNFIATLPTDKMLKILVIGAGGFTMGHNDAFHDYTFVDVEKDLRKVSEEKFLEQNLLPNKKFVVQDAMQFLKTDEKFDLIITDAYNGIVTMPFHLLTVEYFELLKSRLSQNGVVVMNVIASGNFNNEFSLAIDNTLHAVFPNLQRQVLGKINPWSDSLNYRNVIYVYYDKENSSNSIYTNDKNRSFYDIY